MILGRLVNDPDLRDLSLFEHLRFSMQDQCSAYEQCDNEDMSLGYP
jgi:hypothetical protein